MRHILEAIADIDRALAGKSYEEFASDTLLEAGVERLLERISEATRHIPTDVKTAESSIPWQKVADFGNRLRHAYHGIDPEIVWQIATKDIQPLKHFVQRIIEGSKSR